MSVEEPGIYLESVEGRLARLASLGSLGALGIGRMLKASQAEPGFYMQSIESLSGIRVWLPNRQVQRSHHRLPAPS